jgi:hypothetical protein
MIKAKNLFYLKKGRLGKLKTRRDPYFYMATSSLEITLPWWYGTVFLTGMNCMAKVSDILLGKGGQ